MRTFKNLTIAAAFAAVIVMSAGAFAENGDARPVRGFDDVLIRDVEIWSDGTRLAGNILYPKDHTVDNPLPALVMCHGWGGTKGHLNLQIAPRFAQAGYVVLTFDYRGWGESDPRLVVQGEIPKPDENGMVTVQARAIQQLVDPLDQQEDIDAAISYIEGEPGVDKDRIAIWGSSYGGGHVIWRAAHDDRVKCVLAQVGSMDSRIGLSRDPGLDVIHANKVKRARGELDPVPLDEDKPEGLTGTPYYDRFVEFVPVDHAHMIDCPVIIIDADKEHYFDIKEHGGKVAKILKENDVPVEYHVFEDTQHYDVYRGEKLDETMKLEIAFLDKHLKK